MNKILKTLVYIGYALFFIVILAISVRGIYGNPTSQELNSPQWKIDGPFELSPERGRFALTYSLVEDSSFYFSDEIGTFASPDVAVQDGRYVSLFAPVLSFLAIPGYAIGSYFGASQVGAFSTSSIFALFNIYLIYLISKKLGADSAPAIIASMLFIFATPAFSYAVSLYQHHISTFLILASIYALLKSSKAIVLLLVFFLSALSVPLDYPNLFLMFPIGLFALGKIYAIDRDERKITFKISILKALTPLIMILPIIFFLWFNQVSFGNPFQLSGTLQTTVDIETSKDLAAVTNQSIAEEKKEEKNAIGFFKTRALLRGFTIHTVSKDRGILYYTPVMLFGLAGLILALKKKTPMMPVLAAIMSINIILYSMWGDPWGGWAFGSRYMIPSYALLSICIALLFSNLKTYSKKSLLFILLFIPTAFYSIAVNVLGAITTSAIPPQVQVLELEKLSGIVQKYTYERNLDFLYSGNIKSFVYQTFLEGVISPVMFYETITFSLFIVLSVTIIWYMTVSQTREIS